MISDLELVYLWRQYSEEHYCAGWIVVQPDTLEQFKTWLEGQGDDGEESTLADYEREDLPAIREAYQSRLREPDGKSGKPILKVYLEPQALKESLKAKAVSVASAMRDGTATAELVRSFLQEDIPPLDSQYPLPDVPETGASEELAAEFKAASAFALIKGIGSLMRCDPDTAGNAVNEYLELRYRAEKAGLAWAVINPPGGDDPLDPDLRDPPVELYRMIYLEGIEDPRKQWDEMLRFTREDIRRGLNTKKGDPDWNYR